MKRRMSLSSRYCLALISNAVSSHELLFWLLSIVVTLIMSSAEYVCTIASSCSACPTNARYGGWYGRRFCSTSTSTHGWNGNAADVTIWHATNGLLLILANIFVAVDSSHGCRFRWKWKADQFGLFTVDVSWFNRILQLIFSGNSY